jgi:hypothetical protein
MLSVNPSAPSTRSVPLTSPVCKINVKIHALVFAVATQPAQLTTTTPSASVIQDTREILSMHATEKLHFLPEFQPNILIHVTHLHVDLMQNVKQGIEQQHANVYQNILETHMLHVVRNVLSTQTVHLTKHVRETNVSTPVLEHVE